MNATEATHIRWMIRRDMQEVLDIERRCFEFPWSATDFTRALKQRNCIGMVAERGERVVGFVVYELHRSRIQVLDLAVHPEEQRCGIGAEIVVKLVNKLTTQRREKILATVRESNLDALMFFKSQGFQAVNILRDHWEETGDDAILMQYKVRA